MLMGQGDRGVRVGQGGHAQAQDASRNWMDGCIKAPERLALMGSWHGSGYPRGGNLDHQPTSKTAGRQLRGVGWQPDRQGRRGASPYERRHRENWDGEG